MSKKEYEGPLYEQHALPESLVPFRDLRIVDSRFREELLQQVDDVLSNGPILMGPRVAAFEKQIAEYSKCRYCVGVSSGTDALYLALRTAGIGSKDEVITTPMSWVATVNAIRMLGATPVFADVDLDLNIDPNCIEPLISSRTRAILPVHFTGRLCDMDAISSIATKYDLLVIEDAAQSLGARTESYCSGSMGHLGTFSINPMKVLPGYGEAGAVVTNNKEFQKRLRTLRYLGTQEKEVCVEISLNYKMDEIQAAMLLVGLNKIDNIVETRNQLARRYSSSLAGIVGCPSIQDAGDYTSNYFDYVICAERRDDLRVYLQFLDLCQC